MAEPQFVHLRVHTEYSLLDSVVRVKPLVARVRDAAMPAVAITDQNNLFAMVKFYRAALAAGVKPIIGVDLHIRPTDDRSAPTRFSLLCLDQTGYGNVTRLVTRAYLEGQLKGVPLVERSWLTAESCQGLIALSGAGEGDVGRALANGRDADAEELIFGWQAVFGERYFLELQRVGRAVESAYIAAATLLAARTGTPVVATNDVRFLSPTDFEAHEARVCIHEGSQLVDPNRVRRYTAEQYLRTGAEMAELFADIPEALANSVEIARRCNLSLTLGEARLPVFPAPAGTTIEEFIRAEAERGLERRLLALGDARAGSEQDYRERLKSELVVICDMGFAGYFLIVADFIRWARENGVPVGPGRGSGAGSLVAYALRITDIDPLKYDLLFERFLNPERVSMPDFNVDFCMDGRDRVIEYVAQRYGRERVSQIITYGSMAAKAVVRDTGRVLGMSYGFVDRIAKLIPFELGITLEDALTKEAELKRLYKEDEEIRNLIDLARSLEGLTRNAGMHAGGVVIAPSVLTDFAPLYADASGGSVVTQFDKDDVEAAGLVKFDFLGLRTLTVIDRAVVTINRLRAARGESPVDIEQLPMDDAATYQLLKACRTTAVFQLESRGMKDLIRRLQPDTFEEIIALVALFRPGPLQSGMVDDFIARKHDGKKAHAPPIDYLHPSLAEVLAPTYGVILYQEQVMQIAQILAGYTLGGADLLRRAMGKKKPEEMAKQREIFVQGAIANRVPERQAAHIFDLMEKFAGYGFNKSHSAAYALLSYQTAWLKTHYPAAYMAAVLSADMDHTDKVVTLIDECKTTLALEVLPPHVNSSHYEFTVADDRTIRYGLGAIKGVGRGAVDVIVGERAANGEFTSLEDFCHRLDLGKINRRTNEALIKAGSFDGLAINRATLMHRLPAALALGEQNTRAVAAGQVDLFGLAAPQAAPDAVRVTAPDQPDWTEAVRLAGERETLGLYLTGHPVDRFANELRRFASSRIADLVSDRPVASADSGPGFFRGKPATVAGLVHEVRRRGTRVAILLDDKSGQLEVAFFEDVYQQFKDLIVKDALLLIEGQLRFDEFIDAWRLQGRKVTELERLREREARRILLRWPATDSGGSANPASAAAADGQLVERLEATLAPWRGGSCQIAIQYASASARAALSLGAAWNVRPTRELLEQLELLVGQKSLDVLYSAPLDHDAAVGGGAQ
ncbi:MAG TPA: DNA polymerase III subunit alpha [Steroidobacteraceae bacterium]|nr:DNA polymerase III subunit alpha [Steroidobacteraceae bacterium]